MNCRTLYCTPVAITKAPSAASGALIHVLPDWIYSRYTVYAALPSRRMLPARTKVFLDFVSEQVPQAVVAQQGR